MSSTYFLACQAEHVDAATGECSQPFYAPPPHLIPMLSIEDSLLITGGILGVWTIGLCARLLIRVGQQNVGRN